MVNEQIDLNKFLHEHLRHRLTLLRTLRKRPSSVHDYKAQGDIYRCVKDSNLIAVRLLMDFLGIKGQNTNNNYSIIGIKKFHDDDVRIDKFIGRLLTENDILINDRRVLAGVYVRADKELAHLTTLFNDEFNEEKILIEAATIIESLLQKYLYDHLGIPLPEIDE
jgi:hypothetical protein